MIKHFLLILTFVILQACSGGKNVKQISSRQHDFFSEESFLRFDNKRLQAFQDQAPCFSGNIIDDLKELRSQLDKRKDEPQYWNQIGTCYYLNQDYTKAEYYYQLSLGTAEKLNHTYAPALNNLGILNVKLGHYIQARDYFRKSLKGNRNHTPRYNLALVHLKYNKPEKAIKLLTRFPHQDSSDPDLNFNLAYTYYLLGDFKQCRYHLSKMGAYDSRSDAHYLKAILLYDEGKYQDVLEILEKTTISITEFNKSNNLLKSLAEKKLEELEELAEKKKKAPKVTSK